jgi:hypothetical protein
MSTGVPPETRADALASTSLAIRPRSSADRGLGDGERIRIVARGGDAKENDQQACFLRVALLVDHASAEARERAQRGIAARQHDRRIDVLVDLDLEVRERDARHVVQRAHDRAGRAAHDERKRALPLRAFRQLEAERPVFRGLCSLARGAAFDERVARIDEHPREILGPGIVHPAADERRVCHQVVPWKVRPVSTR